MKMTILTEEDVRKLQGKFVLQVNSNEPNQTLTKERWDFVKEKRLKLVCGFGFVDLYGNKEDRETFENFQNIFNSYLYKHMIEKGETDGGRFHRLLTSKELDFVCERMKEENY